MSIQAVAWVLENSQATYADRLVLIAIANHIGPTGWAWPSIQAIADEARVDRSTVFRALDELVAIGELVVRSRPGKPNLYGLTALCDPSQSATPQGSQSATPGVASARQGGRNLRPESFTYVKEPNARAGAREADPRRLDEALELDADTRKRGAEFFRSVRLKKETQ